MQTQKCRLITLLVVLSTLMSCSNSSLNLRLVISLDDDFETARNGIVQAIRAYNQKLSDDGVSIQFTIISSNDDVEKSQFCSDLMSSRENLLLFEARTQNANRKNDLKLIARNLQLPMISAIPDQQSMDEEWINLDPNESQFLVTLQQPSTSIMRSLLDIGPYFQINRGVVFFEPDLNWHLGCLVKEASLVNYTFQELKTNDINEISKILRSFKKANQINYLVFGKSKIINKFLESFHLNDMFRQPYRLFVVSKDKGKIKCISCKHGQLIIGQPVMTSLSDYTEPEKIPSDLKLEDRLEFYFFYDITRLILAAADQLSQSGQWLSQERTTWTCSRIGNGQVKTSRIPLLERLVESADEYFGKYGEFKFTTENMESRGKPAIGYQELSVKLNKQVYSASSIQIESLGEWEPGLPNGRIYFTAKQLEDREKETMKILVFLSPPFLTKKLVNALGETEYEGFLIDLLEEMKKKLGSKFPKYELIESSEESIGSIEYNPEEDQQQEDILGFTGLIRELSDSDYEMALAPVEITEERELAVQFSEPIFEAVGFSILMKKPRRESHVWKFVTVLEGDVWLCITGAYLFTSILLAIFDRYSPFSYRNRPEKYTDEESKKIFTLKESLWFCFISLTPQGGGGAPKCISGRLVAAIWWLFGFIFVASYTANLAAFLTVSRLENKVDNMETLSKHYKVRYAPVENSAADVYFNKMAFIEDKYYEIWKNLSLDDNLSEEERAKLAVWEYPVSDRYTKIKAQMVEAQKPSSLEAGFRRVKESPSSKEGFALISNSLDVEYFAYLDCDVYKTGNDFAFHPIAIPIHKETKFDIKALIDPVLRELKDSGFITELKVKYWDDNPKRKTCPDYRKLSNGLGLFDTWGMFLVIGVGVVVTLIVSSIENWIIVRWQKKMATKFKNIPKKFLR